MIHRQARGDHAVTSGIDRTGIQSDHLVLAPDAFGEDDHAAVRDLLLEIAAQASRFTGSGSIDTTLLAPRRREGRGFEVRYRAVRNWRPRLLDQAHGESKNGKELLTYLLSEHAWDAESNGRDYVLKGDIVADCGAHVGVFTDIAMTP